jgi:hypothetical protein
MAVPKKTINDILNPRVVDKEKYISEDINYLKDIINKKAGVIDMMSPGPLKDELRGTYDPTQESYEEFLQRQSIPQMDRPLTGQAPSDAILETQRIDLNEGGVLGPGGMIRGEDLGTREGFATPDIRKVRHGFANEIQYKFQPIRFYQDKANKKYIIQYHHPKTFEILETKSVPATDAGIEKAKQVVRDFNTKYQKFDSYLKNNKINFNLAVDFKTKAANQLLNNIDEFVQDPKYTNVKQIEEKLFKKYNTPEYTSDYGNKGAFFDPKTKTFSFPRNYEMFGYEFGKRKPAEKTSLLKQIIGIKTFQNKSPNYKNSVVNLTKFYLQDPKNPTYDPKGNERLILKKFLKEFSFSQSFKGGKYTGLPVSFFKTLNFNLKNKVAELLNIKTLEETLKQKLADPNLSKADRILYESNRKAIDANRQGIIRALKNQIPNLFTYKAKAGYMQLDHRIGKALSEQGILNLPKDYITRATYVPGRFNEAKNYVFDSPLRNAIEGYNVGTPEEKLTYKKEIKNLVNDFNNRTNGYLKNLNIKFNNNIIEVIDKTPQVADLNQKNILKTIDKNIQHSNAFFKSYKNEKVPGMKKGVPTKSYIIEGANYNKFKNFVNMAQGMKFDTPTSAKGLGANVPRGSTGSGAAGYALLGGMVLSPVIKGFLEDVGVMDKPRGVPMASLDGEKYIPEESSFAEDAALTALGGATVLGGGLAGKKLIEKTTGQYAPMIKGVIGKALQSPFALPFRATGLDRMAMKKLGLLPEDQTLAQTYDPRTASGRTALGLEATAAGVYKPIAEGLTSWIKNQTAKNLATGILKLGPKALNLANVLSKAARVTTPLGLTYLLGEGAYHLLIKPQKEYLESLDPEERKTVEQQYADVAAAEGGIIRKAYKDAGLVEKLGRGATALDPRNIPYYGAKTLKGLGSGVEMAVKFPVAAGAAIGETIQKGPRKETLTKFGEAVQPSATQYLSEKTGLESLIRKQEKELAEKRPGALAMGDVLELGAEFVAPATGYIKMLEDGSSKLYKVIRDGQAGKKVDPKDIDEVLELLSDKGVERRDFMAVVGGTSALALAKHVGIIDALKILEKTKPVRMLSKSASKMPEWFPSFASRILDDTNSVFKQVDEDLVEITNKNLPDVSVGKYSSGRWEISGYNEYGKPYLIDYEPPFILEDGTKYAGDFSVFDNVPSRMGPDDVEFDSELVESIDDVLGGTSKLEEWTTGVKKKNLTPGEKRVIEAEGRAEAEYDAWKESDDFVDE